MRGGEAAPEVAPVAGGDVEGGRRRSRRSRRRSHMRGGVAEVAPVEGGDVEGGRRRSRRSRRHMWGGDVEGGAKGADAVIGGRRRMWGGESPPSPTGGRRRLPSRLRSHHRRTMSRYRELRRRSPNTPGNELLRKAMMMRGGE